MKDKTPAKKRRPKFHRNECDHDDIRIVDGWSSICKKCGCVDVDGLRYTMAETAEYIARDIRVLAQSIKRRFIIATAKCPHCSKLLSFSRPGLFVCQLCRQFVFIGANAECVTEADAKDRLGVETLDIIGIANFVKG